MAHMNSIVIKWFPLSFPLCLYSPYVNPRWVEDMNEGEGTQSSRSSHSSPGRSNPASTFHLVEKPDPINSGVLFRVAVLELK